MQDPSLSPLRNRLTVASCFPEDGLPLFDGLPADFIALLVRGFPHLPGSFAAAIAILELLAVLKRVHAGPVALILVSKQLLGFDQPLKRLLNQLFALFDQAEHFRPED